MAWYQSVEGISKLLLMLAGLVLLFMGKAEIGMTLLASTGLLAAAKAKDNKKLKDAAPIIFLAGILFLGSMGCGMLQELPGEVIDLNMQVYDVHDEYVMEDLDLTEVERQQLLRSTAILREIMILLKSGANSVELMIKE